MIQNFISKKNVAFGISRFFSAWIDFLFPPLCVSCKETCRTTLLCPFCWELCALPDPEYRCRHCFIESDTTLCRQCQKEPFLWAPYASTFEATQPAMRLASEKKERPESIAAFMMVQWARLNWPTPNFIIPLPGAESLAKPLAIWLDVPHLSLLKSHNENWECRSDWIEEDQIFLLIDLKSSPIILQKAIKALSEAFPKRVYVLTLMYHDFSNHC